MPASDNYSFFYIIFKIVVVVVIVVVCTKFASRRIWLLFQLFWSTHHSALPITSNTDYTLSFYGYYLHSLENADNHQNHTHAVVSFFCSFFFVSVICSSLTVSTDPLLFHSNHHICNKCKPGYIQEITTTAIKRKDSIM